MDFPGGGIEVLGTLPLTDGVYGENDKAFFYQVDNNLLIGLVTETFLRVTAGEKNSRRLTFAFFGQEEGPGNIKIRHGFKQYLFNGKFRAFDPAGDPGIQRCFLRKWPQYPVQLFFYVRLSLLPCFEGIDFLDFPVALSQHIEAKAGFRFIQGIVRIGIILPVAEEVDVILGQQ